MKTRAAGIALVAAYALVTLVLTLRHEPWRDEADSWLVARDIPAAEWIDWSRNAGTPGLWYALLLPLARGGLPYVTQAILHWAISVAFAALLVARAPFSLVTKGLFLFSFYGLYQYAVIARSYALGILLTFAIAALHGERLARPIAYGVIVALLANANVHGAGIAGAVIAAYAIELVVLRRANGRRVVGLSIMCAGMVLAFVQLYTPGHIVPPVVVSPPWFGAFMEAASRGFLPAFEGFLPKMWAAAILVVMAMSIRRSLHGLAVLVIGEVALALIFTYAWIGGFRHYGLVLIVAMTALWIGSSESYAAWRRTAIVMLSVSFVLSLPIAFRFAHADLTRAYSGSKEMAEFMIEQQLFENVAAHPPAHAEAVLAHLPKTTFWYAALREPGSYMRWDRRYRVAMGKSATEGAANAAEHFGGRPWLFLSNTPLPQPEKFGLTLEFETKNPLIEPRDVDPRPNDEKYWLYRSR